MRKLCLIVIFAAFASGCSESGVEIERSDYEEKWPLTVEKGTVYCLKSGNRQEIWFETEDGIKYALNGAARKTYPPIDPIWKYDEKMYNDLVDYAKSTGATRDEILSIDKVRINISTVANVAYSLCD